jgi:uncharacterized protein (TIGR03437 family)
MYGSSLAIAGQQAQSLPLPQVLGQANITINGRSAPMLFASPLQVNFQVPWSTATGTASLAMNVAGQLGGPVNITVVRTAPAIYIAQHAGRGAVSVGDPAVPGETIVVYASGLGPVAGDVADGAAPVGLVQTQTPVSATVGTQDARVTFAGLAPGMVGVYQVNVELPSTLPTTAALVLKVADTTSVAYPLR